MTFEIKQCELFGVQESMILVLSSLANVRSLRCLSLTAGVGVVGREVIIKPTKPNLVIKNYSTLEINIR